MITLIGHGYIGKAIAKELERQMISFRWVSHDQKEIVDYFTSLIINAAGFTGTPNVDACEIYKEETIEGNVYFPLNLQMSAWFRHIPVIHITSGCVYNDYIAGGWKETDKPNFSFNNGSFYSGSKVMFQDMMRPYLKNSYLLRIRMPFDGSKDKKNILTKLSSYDKLIDNLNSYSYVKDVARVAVHFAEKRPEAGIYNVCNPGAMTTATVANKLGLEKQWMTAEEFKSITKAPRSNCTMNVDKLMKVFPIQSIDSAMDEAVKEYLDKT